MPGTCIIIPDFIKLIKMYVFKTVTFEPGRFIGIQAILAEIIIIAVGPVEVN
jgi:hypothetical protein